MDTCQAEYCTTVPYPNANANNKVTNVLYLLICWMEQWKGRCTFEQQNTTTYMCIYLCPFTAFFISFHLHPTSTQGSVLLSSTSLSL